MDDGRGWVEDSWMDDGWVENGWVDDGWVDDGWADDVWVDDGWVDDGWMNDGRVDDRWLDDGWVDDGWEDGLSLCKDCFVYHLPKSSGRILNLIKSTVLPIASLRKSPFACVYRLIHDSLFQSTKSEYSALQNFIYICTW